MIHYIKIIGLCVLILILGGCQDLVKLTRSPEEIVFFNLNKAQTNGSDNTNQNILNNTQKAEDLSQNLNEEFLEKYSLQLGRTDPDIKSMKTYIFDLVSDLKFELQGVDARSSILEFKKDNFIIFRWVNYDYEIDRELVDSMYPNLANYSIVGGHTNILILEDEESADDLLIFQNSLRINGQLVFEYNY